MQQQNLESTFYLDVPQLVYKENIGCGVLQRVVVEAGSYEITSLEPVDGQVNLLVAQIVHPELKTFQIFAGSGNPKHFDKSMPLIFAEFQGSTNINLIRWREFSNKTFRVDKQDIRKSWINSLSIKKAIDGNPGFRDAQIGAIHSSLAHWATSKESASIVLPTGTGKTETMLALSVAEAAELTIVIVPSKELRSQIGSKFLSLGILRDIGAIGDHVRLPIVAILGSSITCIEDLERVVTANIVVTTPMLLNRNPELTTHLARYATHLFFDEAHHVVAKTWQKIKRIMSTCKILQFTATPYRGDRKPLEGQVLFRYSLASAQEAGHFCSISLVTVDERNPTLKDEAIASAALECLANDRADGYTSHKMMVRAGNKARAEILFDLYRDKAPNENIALIHSSIPGRVSILDDIKLGRYSIIVCVDMLKEGFDYPDFKIAAVHDMHKSLSVTLQFIGRFTRDRADLGGAHLVINFAETEIPKELEKLYAEGSGWEEVIAEEANIRQEQAVEFMNFLSNCVPYRAFDEPDQAINPRLVNPALSGVVYRCSPPDWSRFKDGFSKKHRFSQPYINESENLFYFATQVREKVRWTYSEAVRDQIWNLVLMHYSEEKGLLYVGHSDPRFKHKDIVSEMVDASLEQITGGPVFRCFHDIKRLKIVHAGLLKPANRYHRYSKYSGADVTREIESMRSGSAVKKSDFVGLGYRHGIPVSVGASQKGKVWSPAKRGNVKEWLEWCTSVGQLLIDQSIDENQLFYDSAKTTQTRNFDEISEIAAVDWNEEVIERLSKLSLQIVRLGEFPLYECEFQNWNKTANAIEFDLNIYNEHVLPLKLEVCPENGFKFLYVEETDCNVYGWSRRSETLLEFLNGFPPTMYLTDGSLLSGCLVTSFDNEDIPLPVNFFDRWVWNPRSVDITVESLYKKAEGDWVERPNSIQKAVLDSCVEQGANLVFNDDGPREAADVVAFIESESKIIIQLWHCKFSSSANPGHRVQDLNEVCAQAVKSVKWKWNPRSLFDHLMARCESTGLGQEKRIYEGSLELIAHLKDACDYKDTEFQFFIVQPGLNPENLTDDCRRALQTCNASIVDMTECKLRFVSS